MFEEAGLGDLLVRDLGLGATAAPPDLSAWRELVEKMKRPKPGSRSRTSRSPRPASSNMSGTS